MRVTVVNYAINSCFENAFSVLFSEICLEIVTFIDFNSISISHVIMMNIDDKSRGYTNSFTRRINL